MTTKTVKEAEAAGATVTPAAPTPTQRLDRPVGRVTRPESNPRTREYVDA